MSPLPEKDFGFTETAHLLRRAGFGGSPTEIAMLQADGREAAVEQLVEFETTNADMPANADIMRPWTPAESAELDAARRRGDEATVERFRQDRQRRQRDDRRQLRDLRRWWLDRMIDTPHPLEERMALFWHGHYATGYRKIEDSWHLARQNAMFRRFALGDARSLAAGILADPAMVRYLDGERNVRGNPNENLARELMELFVLGEGRGYTEDDIKELARALTGLSIEDDAVVFDRDRHDSGVKRILGRRDAFTPANVLPVLFARNEASRFLAEKLYHHFVADDPRPNDRETQRVLTSLASLLRRYDFELRPVLRRLFSSRHFYSPRNHGAVIRSPIHLTIGTIRVLGTPRRDPDRLLDDLDRMGQTLFEPPSVKGWNGGRAWINTATLFVRQNASIHLLTGDGDTSFEAERLLEDLPTSARRNPDAVVDRLLATCLSGTPHPDRVRTLRTFLGRMGDRVDRDRLIAMLAIVTAFPEYQLS